jgi:hypothetical protein
LHWEWHQSKSKWQAMRAAGFWQNAGRSGLQAPASTALPSRPVIIFTILPVKITDFFDNDKKAR